MVISQNIRLEWCRFLVIWMSIGKGSALGRKDFFWYATKAQNIQLQRPTKRTASSITGLWPFPVDVRFPDSVSLARVHQELQHFIQYFSKISWQVCKEEGIRLSAFPTELISAECSQFSAMAASKSTLLTPESRHFTFSQWRWDSTL